MSSPSSRILLLGWNEVPRPEEPTIFPLGPFISQLAKLAPLAVLLPSLPQPPLNAGPNAHVTGLANLSLAEALSGGQTQVTERPAAWRPPAAPYAGAARRPAVPAAPYLGATPAETSGAATPTTTAAPLGSEGPAQIPAPTPAAALEQEPADTDVLLDRDDFAREHSEPEAAEAHDLDQDSDEPEAPTQAAPAEPLAPVLETVAPPTAPLRMWYTLTEALASLGMPLPTTADLNFQVIQYARFAIRRAFQEPFAVIYAVDWPTWLAAMEIRQLTGRPLVLHVQSLAQEKGPTSGWGPALERLALRRADLVLATTDELAQRLAEQFQLPPERLRTVALTDTATINTFLQQLETRRPGHPARTPLYPPTA